MKTGWIQYDYLYDCGSMAKNTKVNDTVDYEGGWHISDFNEKSNPEEILDAKPVIYLF